MTDSPVVALNRAVAVGMAFGPTAGLALLEEPGLSSALAGYHLFHATRADFLRRAGDLAASVTAYEAASFLATNVAERAYFARRIAEVATVSEQP